MEELQTKTEEKRRRGYRSLFWPLMLVGVGVVWLLGNLGLISTVNLTVLLKLWPLLLIVIGLDLLIGRRSPALGALIGLAAVVAVIFLLVTGPAMGLADANARFFGLPLVFTAGDVDVKTAHFSEEINDAEKALIDLDLGRWPTAVYALNDSRYLIDANVAYTGEMQFNVRGMTTRSITLDEIEPARIGVVTFPNSDEYRWDIGLSPDVPIDLDVGVGSGPVVLDLQDLILTALDVSGGSGSIDLMLPLVGESYFVALDMGSGPVAIDIPEDSQVEMDVSGGSGGMDVAIADGAVVDLSVDMGSGSLSIAIGDDASVEITLGGGSGGVTVDVPEGAAVRVEVKDSGSGSLNLPGDVTQVRAGVDEGEGVWETEDFEQADAQIIIVVTDQGSGGVTVR